MKTYYIYHIPDFVHPDGRIGKIGCSEVVNDRVHRQGHDSFEILEEHTDIYVASNREIELQIEYEYPVDKVLYWQVRENNNKVSRSIRSQNGINAGSQTGRRNGRLMRKLTLEQANEIRMKYPNSSMRQLGKEYGVAPSLIHAIVNNIKYLE